MIAEENHHVRSTVHKSGFGMAGSASAFFRKYSMTSTLAVCCLVGFGGEYYLMQSDDKNHNSFNSAGYWSSGAAPSAGGIYTVTNIPGMSSPIRLNLSGKAPSVFAGDRLNLGSPNSGRVLMMGWGAGQTYANYGQNCVYQIDDLHVWTADVVCNNTGYISFRGRCEIHQSADGNVGFVGLNVAENSQRGIVFDWKMVSEPDVTVDMYCEKGDNDKGQTSRFYIQGDMSDWNGKIKAMYNSTTVVFNSPTMCAGGTEAFVADRLTLDNNAVLAIYPKCVQNANWGVTVGSAFCLESDEVSGAFSFMLPVTAADSTRQMTVRGPYPITLENDMTAFAGTLVDAGHLVLGSSARLPSQLPIHVNDGKTLGFATRYDAVSGEAPVVDITGVELSLGEGVTYSVAVTGLEPFTGTREFEVARFTPGVAVSAGQVTDLTVKSGGLPNTAVKVSMDGGVTVLSVVAAYGEDSRVWTGMGADNLFGTAENWNGNGQPDVVLGNLMATFASGGNEAVVDGDVRLAGIVLDLPADNHGFSITKAGESGKVILGVGGLSTCAPTGDADSVDRLSVNVPVELDHSQEWKLSPRTEVEFSEAISGSADIFISAPQPLLGPHETFPVVSLNADNSGLVGTFRSTNVCYRVRGVDPFGTGQGKALINHTVLNGAKDVCAVAFEGCDISRQIEFRAPYGAIGVPGFSFAAMTTNVFKRTVGLYHNGGESTHGSFYFHEDSLTVFDDETGAEALSGSGQSMLFYGSGTVDFRRRFANYARVAFGGRSYDEMLNVVLRDGGNYGFNISVYEGCKLDVLANDALITRYYSDCSDYLNPDKDRMSVGLWGTMDIHGTTQTLWRITGDGVVTSSIPALVRIGGGLDWNDGKTWHMPIRFDGPIDVLMQFGNVTVSGESASQGSLSVTNGNVRFVDSGNWRNASSVTVIGDGYLEVEDRTRFGTGTVWRVGGNGRVSLKESALHLCGGLYLSDDIDAVPAPPGRYGSAEASLKHPGVIANAHFAGPGFLRVKAKVGGMCVVVR